jgi:hypothetical protein
MTLKELVDEQAKDAGLWFVARYASEAYLQQELRKLHAAVESDTAKLRDLAQRLAVALYFYTSPSMSDDEMADKLGAIEDVLIEARAAGLLSVPLEGK